MRRKFQLGVKQQLLFYQEEFDQIFQEAKIVWTEKAHREIIRRMKIATGRLLESTYAVYTRSKRGGYHIKLNIDADYWEKVEKGRGSGDAPSVSDLVTWIRAKRRAFKKYDQDGNVNKGLFYVKGKSKGYAYHRMTDKEAAEKLQARIEQHGTRSSRHRFEGLAHSASANTPVYRVFPNLMFKKIGEDNYTWLQNRLNQVERVSLTKTKNQMLSDPDLEKLINQLEDELLKVFVRLSSKLKDVQRKDESALAYRKRTIEEKDKVKFVLKKEDIKEYRAEAKKLVKQISQKALGLQSMPKGQKINRILNKVNRTFVSLQKNADTVLIGSGKTTGLESAYSIELDTDFYRFEKLLSKTKFNMEISEFYKLINKLLREAKRA